MSMTDANVDHSDRESLLGLVDENWPMLDDRAAAEALLEYAGTSQLAREILVSVVANAIAAARRTRIRRMEQAINLPPVDPSVDLAEPTPRRKPRPFVPADGLNLAELRNLSALTFKTARGERGVEVTFGSATRDQHRERISELAALERSISVTRDRHERVLALLVKAGVDSLDQLLAANPKGQAA